MKDIALVPLYFAYDTWATRIGYEFSPLFCQGLRMPDNLRLTDTS
jgi:hypothetical protein